MVKWYWIPLDHTVISFLALLIIWSNIQREVNPELVTTSLGFLIWLFPIIIMQFIMLAVLPDNEPSKDLDLLVWYFQHHKYYYSLMGLFVFSLILNRFLLGKTHLYDYLPLILLAPASILFLSKNYRVHAGLTLFIFSYFFLIFYLQLYLTR
jgi:hypothetical protein